MNELTQPNRWDDLWMKISLPAQVDSTNAPELEMSRVIRKILQRHRPLDVLDVGCCPGRWLAHFHSEYGCNVHGIDYTETACAVTRENLELLGIPGTVTKGDIQTLRTPEKFDVVTSFGLVEHFRNPLEILQRQRALLNPGGRLICSVPNLRFLNGMIQRFLDRDILSEHNQAIMSMDYFRRTSKTLGLTPEFIGYVGMFWPWLFHGIHGRISSWIARGLRRTRFARRPSFLYSPYILYVGRAP